MNKEVLASHVADIEAGMKEYMPEENGYQRTVFEAVNYSLLAGGKRLRPMFLYEAYRMFGGTDEKAVRPFMMALEMIHTYSLVHDDLPAMTEAAQIGRALKILGHKAGMYGMVGGQVVDVEKDGCFMDEDMLYFVHKNKTSALIEAALMTGAVLAGADEKQAAVMEQCGTDIGLAFQIQDDILDVIGDQEKLGKPVHSDEKNEKTTAVSVYGIDVCRQKVKDYTDRGIEALEALDIPGKEHQKFLVELMKSLVGREM